MSFSQFLVPNVGNFLISWYLTGFYAFCCIFSVFRDRCVAILFKKCCPTPFSNKNRYFCWNSNRNLWFWAKFRLFFAWKVNFLAFYTVFVFPVTNKRFIYPFFFKNLNFKAIKCIFDANFAVFPLFTCFSMFLIEFSPLFSCQLSVSLSSGQWTRRLLPFFYKSLRFSRRKLTIVAFTLKFVNFQAMHGEAVQPCRGDGNLRNGRNGSLPFPPLRCCRWNCFAWAPEKKLGEFWIDLKNRNSFRNLVLKFLIFN